MKIDSIHHDTEMNYVVIRLSDVRCITTTHLKCATLFLEPKEAEDLGIAIQQTLQDAEVTKE